MLPENNQLGSRDLYERSLRMSADMSLLKTAEIMAPLTDAQVAVAVMNLGRLFLASHGYGQPGRAHLVEVDDMAERVDQIFEAYKQAAYAQPAAEVTDE